MATFDGSLARTLDFGEPLAPETTPKNTRIVRWSAAPADAGSRVLPWRGSDKYRVLEHRRRQAQIRARRLLAAWD
jgi:hypothetical protein